MPETVVYRRRVGWAWYLVTILLVLALALCVYEIMERKDRESQILQDRIAREEADIRALTGRIAFINSLLPLPPCEARTKWKMP